MAKRNIKNKNTIGAEGGIDLEQDNISEGKIKWNKDGNEEHALNAKTGEDTLTYTNEGRENKMIHTGNIEQYISQDKNFEFEVSVPSTLIVVNHPLGKKVAVEFIDTAGTRIRTAVTKNDGLQVIIKSNAPIAGTVILN